MTRERVLKVVLVLVGLLFSAGVFLLMSVRKPSANRSLIAFAAWSSFAHGVVMAVLAVHIPKERTGLLIAVAVLVAIGVALIVLAPAKQSRELAPATAA